MKKIILVATILAVSALGISNQELFNLSDQAGISLIADKSLSTYLKEKKSQLPDNRVKYSENILPVQLFAHECYINDIAVFFDLSSKKYVAAPRDDSFKQAWNASCDRLREIIKPAKKSFNSKPLKLKSGISYLKPARNIRPENRWYIAKIDGSPSSDKYEIGDYVGNNAWLIKPKGSSWTEKIVFAAEFTPDKKIDPALYFHDSYQVGDSPGLRTVIVHVLNSKKLAETKSQIEKLNGKIISEISLIGCVTVIIPVENISGLSENDNIKWIEKARPPLTICNDGARSAVGASTAQNPPYNYSGTNVDVLVYDGGMTSAHNDYASRMSNIESGSTHYHATHVAGTVLGDGTQSSGQYRGMAPRANLLSGEYDGNAGALFYNNPADIEGDYNTAINSFGADLANNSIGMNIQLNGYPDSYYGDYETCCILLDNIATGLLGRTFLSIWAAGNERGYVSGYKNIAPPQCAKNTLVVGATYSDNNQITDFSSFGPLDDGRLKPDLCAPGDENGAGIYSTYGTSSYQNLAGTSMASPVATGCAALLTECWKDYNSGANPAPEVVKAVLINTTLDLDAPGPGYDTGYGLIQIVHAINAVELGNIIESEISDGDSTVFSMLVADTAAYVRVTLAWSDPAASPMANPALVNDLDLKLIDPLGGVHYPWSLNPSSPASPATNNGPDHTNNVEQVYASNVTGGMWKVKVSGFNVPVGSSQAFAICGNNPLLVLSSHGSINLNRSSYTAPASAEAEVKDLDLTNESSVTVLAYSGTDPSGETISLTTTSPGVFNGIIPLITGAPAADGSISVSHGDTLSVVYNDADNGMGGTNVPNIETATIDLAPPAIFNVGLVSASDSQATIEWDTDKSAKGSLVIVSPSSETFETGFTTSHQLTLNALTPGTDYQFYIIETDPLGLTTTNDNSGHYFSFSTKIFDSSFFSDAEGDYGEWSGTTGWHRSQLRPLSGSWSWYCGEEATQEYPNNHEAYLTSPEITINGPAATLHFKEYVDTEDNYDYCYVQINTDGVNWIDLRPEVDGAHSTRQVSLTLDSHLPGTFRIRFFFESDFSLTEEGWYVDDIQIGGFTFSNLVVDSTSASDPAPGGDNDGFVEPNETIELQAVLFNDIDQPLSNVNSILFTACPYVSLLQSSSHYGNMPANSYATNFSLFEFSLASATPNHSSLPFTLVSSDNAGQTWSNDFNIFVNMNPVPEGGLLVVGFVSLLWFYRKSRS